MRLQPARRKIKQCFHGLSNGPGVGDCIVWYPGTHFGACTVCGVVCRLEVVTDPDGTVHTQWTDRLRPGDAVVTTQEKLRRAQAERDAREKAESEAMAKQLANGNVEYGREGQTKEYEPVHKRIKRALADGDFYTMLEPRITELGTSGKWIITVRLEFERSERVYHFHGTAQIDLKDDDGVEKAETRAVGRALGFAGYPGEAGIATAEDIERMERRNGQSPLTQAAQSRNGGKTSEPITAAPADIHNVTAPAEQVRLAPAPVEQVKAVTRTVKEEIQQLDLTGVRKLITRAVQGGSASIIVGDTHLSETERANLPKFAGWCGWSDGDYQALWQQATGKTSAQLKKGATHADWVATWNTVVRAMRDAMASPVAVGA